jgi:hypothetical protein
VVGEALQLVDVMRRDQDGGRRVGQVLGQQRQRAPPDHRVEAVRRLVEQQERRAVRERQHELEASRLALRQPADPPLRPDAEGAREVVGVGVVPLRVEGRRVPEQPGARHRPVRGILALGHVAHLRPHLGPLPPGVQPEDLRGAGVGALQVHEHLDSASDWCAEMPAITPSADAQVALCGTRAASPAA